MPQPTSNLAELQRRSDPNDMSASRRLFPEVGTSRDDRIDLQRALLELRGSHPEEALRVLNQVLDAHPANAPALVFKGTAFWDMSNLCEALSSFDAAVKLQPSNELAWSYKALCHLATGEPEQARAIWTSRGFSDNLMYRVRVTEYVEMAWITNGRFLQQPRQKPTFDYRKPCERAALRYFYKRDFKSMVEYLPPTPGVNDFHTFLSGLGFEMLLNYDLSNTFLNALKSKQDEWPDPVAALNGRLLIRDGQFAAGARELAKVETMGYEDYGVNYFFGVVCLAYNKRPEARRFFSAAFGNYMIDTQEFQWSLIEKLLLTCEEA